ncbi:YqaE/Pmp3 family membrane protein [Vibrio alfacsensis]
MYLSSTRCSFYGEGLSKDFIINLVLTFFFFLPGTIHARWLTMK